jgi:hypothetical protein
VESNVSRPGGVDPVKKSEPIYASALRELLDWLCQSRTRLVIIYLALLAIWIGLILHNTGALAVTQLNASVEIEDASIFKSLLVIVGFFVLQAAFLFGGGKIRIQPGPARWYRKFLSLVIFAALMALLCFAFGLTYFQLTGRMPTGNRDTTVGDVLTSNVFWISTGTLWLVWFVIGMVAIRNTQQANGLSRLIAFLLAGSWIEFAVALPVEFVTRPRDRECPCQSGSWLGLIICFPILMWSIGPGLYLLLVREKKLCRQDPGHSRRVLLAKSVRGKTQP